MKKIFARLLVLAVLQLGVMTGVPVDPEEVKKVMKEMQPTKMEFVVKKDDS